MGYTVCMDTKIRMIPDEDWSEFKKGCLAEGVSCNAKLIELIAQYSVVSRTKRKARLIAELDEINQKKMF